MWEKIVLNLVSNAFKYTLAGRITVSLQQAGRFDRAGGRRHRCWHSRQGAAARVRAVPSRRGHSGAHARRHRHRARARAGTREATRGVGECRQPAGRRQHVYGDDPDGRRALAGGSHRLPLARSPRPRSARRPTSKKRCAGCRRADERRGRRATSSTGSSPRRLGALSAMPRVPMCSWPTTTPTCVTTSYRLLSAQYDVDAVPDGLAALAAARRRRPDLVLADVMMPSLDGFGLVRELRSDADLSAVPVVLLSARAGEEARVEGWGAGADDYLVKPFSARELLARVESHLNLTRVRREADQALKQSLEAEQRAREEAQHASRMKDEFLTMLSHELRTPLNAILGWSQILAAKPNPSSDSIRPGLETIERNVRVQAQLIEDLLDVSRITEGKLRLDVKQVALCEVVEEALASIRPAADAKQIRVQTLLDRRERSGQRRPGSPAAGGLEPPEQRGEVHAEGRPDPGAGGAREFARRAECQRQRRRNRAGVPALRLRSLPPGRSDHDPGVRRIGTGTLDRQASRRAARRHRAGEERRARARAARSSSSCRSGCSVCPRQPA